MARHIDLTNRLDTEKPTITINGKTFEVNDEKSNVLKMNSILKERHDNFEIVDIILETLLGKKAAKEIDNMKLSFNSCQTITLALIACVSDEEIEDVEKRFQD